MADPDSAALAQRLAVDIKCMEICVRDRLAINHEVIASILANARSAAEALELMAKQLAAAEKVVIALEAHHSAVSYVDGGDEDQAWDAVQSALGQYQMNYRIASRVGQKA